MHCAGASFTLLAKTGYTCDVDPFLESYESTTGVDIVKAATAIQLAAGHTVYIVSNAALWFGDTMETSLFNGNIARDAGLEICTDPHDPYRSLGIRDQERGLEIPLFRDGNTIGTDTFKPDRNDVLLAIANNDPNVIFLDPYDEFVPEHLSIGVRSASMSKEPCDYGDVDPAFETLRGISDVYDTARFYEKAISAVKIHDVRAEVDVGSVNAQVATVHATERHSKCTPERISEIFGCGIETARETIRVTTQRGVRSAVHPLRRRYCTDLLSLR